MTPPPAPYSTTSSLTSPPLTSPQVTAARGGERLTGLLLVGSVAVLGGLTALIVALLTLMGMT